MSTREPEPLSNVHDLRGRARQSSDARAHGGPAHGERWTVDPVEPPPWVELPTGSSASLYRLARHPRTGRPARDHLGNLLYVPLAGAVPPAGSRDAARVLAFPGDGRTGRRSRGVGEDTVRTRPEVSTPGPSTGADATGSPLDEDVTG